LYSNGCPAQTPLLSLVVDLLDNKSYKLQPVVSRQEEAIIPLLYLTTLGIFSCWKIFFQKWTYSCLSNICSHLSEKFNFFPDFFRTMPLCAISSCRRPIDQKKIRFPMDFLYSLLRYQIICRYSILYCASCCTSPRQLKESGVWAWRHKHHDVCVQCKFTHTSNQR